MKRIGAVRQCGTVSSVRVARRARTALLCAACGGAPVAVAAQAAPWTKSYANPTTESTLTRASLKLDLNGAGPIEFTRVRAILPRRDGSFLVANGATYELRLFNAAGTFVSSAGRKGSGPGEYQFLGKITTFATDSVAILDGSTRRISILAPDGKFVRSVSVGTPPDALGNPVDLIGLQSGALLSGFAEVSRMAPQVEPVYFAARYYRVETDGGKLTPTGMRFPVSEHFVQATSPGNGGVAYWDRAFGRKASMRAIGAGLLIGDGTEWTVEERSVTGAIVGVHKVNRTVDPVTASDRARYRSFELSGAKGADSLVTERMVAEMPFPKDKPAYSIVEVDPLNRIWLHVYPSTGSTESVWMRLDPRSTRATLVRMPPRFRALAFTASLVYGVWRDDDDLEHVQVYALPPTS